MRPERAGTSEKTSKSVYYWFSVREARVAKCKIAVSRMRQLKKPELDATEFFIAIYAIDLTVLTLHDHQSRKKIDQEHWRYDHHNSNKSCASSAASYETYINQPRAKAQHTDAMRST